MMAFSFAQMLGYLAFLFGVASFLQKSDRRLLFLNVCQCIAYTAHFVLLGSPVTAASAVVSGVRSALAMWTRSAYVAVGVTLVYAGAGWFFATKAIDWLPVIGSSIATLAVFLLAGIPMRLGLLTSTVLWLINAALAGSIGGCMLEVAVGVVNISTIARLYREGRKTP